MESCDLVDTLMLKKSKLYEDTQGMTYRKAPTCCKKNLSICKRNHQSDADHAGCQDTRCSTSGSMQLQGDRLHIDIKYHFIKEQVENGVIELYFVRTEYQLTDIFTKALCRERIEFLIDKLGMNGFTPETLKELVDEAEE
ncbi:hypothetical protein Tco_0887432 [Tanacetum coccineum]